MFKLASQFNLPVQLRSSALICLLGLAAIFAPKAQGKELKVGIVQRFGEEPTDEVTIASPPGDRLTITFGEQTLQTSRVKLEIAMQPLLAPLIRERLVLSNHATFESAENSAQRWQDRGIAVEVTQPGRWQVWAKPEVYKTPLLRRWLLRSLEQQGYTKPTLQTKVLQRVPRASLIVDGEPRITHSLFRQQIEIEAEENRILVTQGEDDQTPRLYPGSLTLQPNAYGNYTLVNQVALSSYLRGVLPYEITSEAPQEAVEAQAIIARTYALRNLRRFAADNYQLCANTHCQVYRGLSHTEKRTDRAIAATKGEVLTYNNELIDALYSSTTGGVTAYFRDIWNGEPHPYLQPVVDSPNPVWDLSQRSLAEEQAFRRFMDLKRGFNETGTSAFRWRRESSLEELSEDLQKYFEKINHPLADFSRIVRMGVVKRSPSGRVLQFNVKTDEGMVSLYKTEVRSAFNPPLSTFFYLEPIYRDDQTLKGYAFVGGGFGHGVGLSQKGSYNLAQLGWSAQEILEFYYPGTKIQLLEDESIVFYDGD